MVVNATSDNPRAFGPYRILERIGEGGMSVVYMALRTGHHEPQIVKVLHEGLAQNPIVSQRFLREAQVASTLHHPHIVPITGAGQEDGRFYLAMEYVRGVELEQVFHACLRAGRTIPPPVTLTLAMDVLAALQYAHAFRDSDERHLGIVHRDLSPRNVLVTVDGQAHVIDFGLARTNLGSFRTQPGMVMGTLRYMSPEQAIAEPVDHRSDLYTFAVVLYELLTTSLLVPDVSAKDILHYVVIETPEPASARNPAIIPALDRVLSRALGKLPEDRYDCAEEFAMDLRNAAAGWCTHPRDEIARFARSVIPEKFDETELRFSRAVAQAKLTSPPPFPDAPEFETTRAGHRPPGFESPVDHATTRTGDWPPGFEPSLDKAAIRTGGRPSGFEPSGDKAAIRTGERPPGFEPSLDKTAIRSGKRPPELEPAREINSPPMIQAPRGLPNDRPASPENRPAPSSAPPSKRRRRWERTAATLAVAVLLLAIVVAIKGPPTRPHPRPASFTERSVLRPSPPEHPPWASAAPSAPPSPPAPPTAKRRGEAREKRTAPLTSPNRPSGQEAGRSSRRRRDARAEAGRLVRWLQNIGARTLDPATEGPRFRSRVQRVIETISDPRTRQRKTERLDVLLGTDPTGEALMPYVQALRAELSEEPR